MQTFPFTSKIKRNKHDKVVTGKHLFFQASDEP